jgi:hypothetical protein
MKHKEKMTIDRNRKLINIIKGLQPTLIVSCTKGKLKFYHQGKKSKISI